MAIINFKCEKCQNFFSSDVGKIIFPTKINERPIFEKEIICSNCGKLTLDEVELTELGQSQLTELWFSE